MFDLIKNNLFKSTTNDDCFKIPFIQTSKIELLPEKKLTLTEDSQKILERDYALISGSRLKKYGAVVIFRTFDNFMRVI